jgi:hypothetical protein
MDSVESESPLSGGELLDQVTSPLLAGFEAVTLAVLFLIVGYLVVHAVTKNWPVDELTRIGLSFLGLSILVLVLMLVHIASRGWLFSSAWTTRLSTLVVAVLLGYARFRASRRDNQWKGQLRDGGTVALACLMAIALLVWCLPVFELLPLDFKGDTKTHLAWAAQLRAANATPTGLVAGSIPNYYPWNFHALLAYLSCFASGGRPPNALGTLQVLITLGSVMTLFALGREIGRSWIYGAAGAVLGSIAGGFGFLKSGGPALVLDPRADGGAAAVQFFGDLLYRRSYNSAFFNLPPPFPRDQAMVLLSAFLLLLVLGIRRRNIIILISAGIALGLVGLTGAEAFIIGVATAIIMVMLTNEMTRIKVAASVLGTAVAVYSLWAAPLVFSHVSLGGFVDTSGELVRLPAYAIVLTWGVTVPLALYGMFRFVERIRKDPGPRVAFAALLASVTVLGLSSFAVAVLGEGFSTLGRQHRYWPLVHFGLVLWALLGLGDALVRLRGVGIWATRTLGVVTVSLAIASPLMAGLSATRELATNGPLTQTLRGERTVLTVASPSLGPTCIAAAPAEISRPVVAYSGYRLVFYPPKTRVRWRAIEERIGTDTALSRDSKLLVSGSGSYVAWLAAAQRHDVNIVIARAENRLLPRLSQFEGSARVENVGAYAVVRLSGCP